jgi:hypothetical protein
MTKAKEERGDAMSLAVQYIGVSVNAAKVCASLSAEEAKKDRFS